MSELKTVIGSTTDNTNESNRFKRPAFGPLEENLETQLRRVGNKALIGLLDLVGLKRAEATQTEEQLQREISLLQTLESLKTNLASEIQHLLDFKENIVGEHARQFTSAKALGEFVRQFVGFPQYADLTWKSINTRANAEWVDKNRKDLIAGFHAAGVAVAERELAAFEKTHKELLHRLGVETTSKIQ